MVRSPEKNQCTQTVNLQTLVQGVKFVYLTLRICMFEMSHKTALVLNGCVELLETASRDMMSCMQATVYNAKHLQEVSHHYTFKTTKENECSSLLSVNIFRNQLVLELLVLQFEEVSIIIHV